MELKKKQSYILPNPMPSFVGVHSAQTRGLGTKKPSNYVDSPDAQTFAHS